MNVASRELSKELFELSGWRGTDFCWDDLPESFYLAPDHQIEGGFPAYDLGYLIRKLVNRNYDARVRYSTNSMNWRASLIHWGSEHIADTPEDATAKLCIKLFKSGVLPVKGQK